MIRAVKGFNVLEVMLVKFDGPIKVAGCLVCVGEVIA